VKCSGFGSSEGAESLWDSASPAALTSLPIGVDCTTSLLSQLCGAIPVQAQLGLRAPRGGRWAALFEKAQISSRKGQLRANLLKGRVSVALEPAIEFANH
jgi:hypothetical protein